MANNCKVEFIKSFNCLFYVSKLFGLVCYNFVDYYRKKVLANSVLGNIWSISTLIMSVVVYHHIVASIYFDGKSFDSGTLTTIIGILMLYMEPLMLSSDIIATLINQRHFIRCIHRLESIDHKLFKENITINYRPLQLLSILLIFILFGRDFLMILFGYYIYELNFIQLWLMNVPIVASILSKIWFVLIVSNIRMKLDAINNHLDEMADSLKATKEIAQNALETNNKIADENERKLNNKSEYNKNDSTITKYLHKEILPRSKPKFLNKILNSNIAAVQPFDANKPPIIVKPSANEATSDGKIHEINIGNKFDQQLTNLCFIHDEICEIASIANNMFSFQILILMTYGFLAITAQLYFVYCSLAGQTIPRLFRSAEHIGISSVIIISTAVVSVYVIHVCWQTKNSAEKTGVFMHKLANIVDENHFYEMINHLSLKLLNHRLNFTACGFFDLDMTTIYAITGAITSYLIILIQFNVAAQRSKKLFMANANASLTAKNASNETV